MSEGMMMEHSNGGFSAAGLRRMREVLAEHVDSGKIPGLVALVSRGGRTHVEALGTMHRDGGAPMSRDTIFRMASTSKPVTVAGGDGAAGRVPTAAGRPGGAMAARTGRPAGAEADRRPAGRHRAGAAADHRT
ncbi:serine hydrolase [Nonomuraea ferruginea]